QKTAYAILRCLVGSEMCLRERKKMLLIEKCLHCNQCKGKCPYGLDTPSLLQKNLEDYKQVLAGKVSVV
ncbi:MAG: 4Fe-4S dicluster domain-containing protein, partial [Lachnospiraceae bacterium]|nr:4Fe-4S dicluster domain-containing protein [Lachnospiraceae bacterium]